jgi:phage baseplate assembly protein gpV
MRNIFIELTRRIADLERRLNNVSRPARVVEIDEKKALVKVAYGLDENGQDVISPWIRWGEQRAGNISTWNPPTVGEQVVMFSPSGEIGLHSFIGHSLYSKTFPQPHDKKDEQKLQVKKDNKTTTVLTASNFRQENVDGEKNEHAKTITHTKRA